MDFQTLETGMEQTLADVSPLLIDGQTKQPIKGYVQYLK